MNSTVINDFSKTMFSKMALQKENFIKEMLLKKGHLMIIESMVEQVRFPKINRSICDGWEYIFVDNNTKQGKFIVAIGPWETVRDLIELEESTASCTTSYSFKWQDKNFDAVKL